MIKEKYNFKDFVDIIRILRGENGCPWDREQTHESLKSCMIEECYEVVEAINNKDMTNLREELGDVLLQVVMHAVIAEETEKFTIADVIQDISEKMIRRHPHVFGSGEDKITVNVLQSDTVNALQSDIVNALQSESGMEKDERQGKAEDAKERLQNEISLGKGKKLRQVETTEDVLQNWEQIKKEEKNENTGAEALNRIPKALPANIRAQKVQKKAAKFGMEFENYEQVLGKVYEELEEMEEERKLGHKAQFEEEFGDLMFSIINLSRFLHINAENSLTNATDKFINRFIGVESLAMKQGKHLCDLSPEQLDALWREIKCQDIK